MPLLLEYKKGGLTIMWSGMFTSVVQRWTILTFSVFALFGTTNAAGTFNIKNYGASGGDSTAAIKAAFRAACSAGGGTVYVPPGIYMTQPFAVERCNGITFQVDGTITAPASKSSWGNYKNLAKGKGWIQFDWCKDLTVVSSTKTGTFDGKASRTNWWNSGQKNPISLSFTHCENLILRDITVKNSPGTNIQVDLQQDDNSRSLLCEGITIDNPDDSPNTDGIHIARLYNVIIRNSKIGCGDDCVVLQTNCKNVLVENIDCGPGNGVSLGSLGNFGDASCMSNILVQNCIFRETHFGARIKAWGNKGAGAATGVVFRNLTMINARRPVIVTQCYAGGKSRVCTASGKSVAMYDILFENIRGTCFRGHPCVMLSCMDGTPCVGIKMRNIQLTGGDKICSHAYGSEDGVSHSGCLQSGLPPASGRSSAASRVAVCGYGSRGYYTDSGPAAPGCPLAQSPGYRSPPPSLTPTPTLSPPATYPAPRTPTRPPPKARPPPPTTYPAPRTPTKPPPKTRSPPPAIYPAPRTPTKPPPKTMSPPPTIYPAPRTPTKPPPKTRSPPPTIYPAPRTPTKPPHKTRSPPPTIYPAPRTPTKPPPRARPPTPLPTVYRRPPPSTIYPRRSPPPRIIYPTSKRSPPPPPPTTRYPVRRSPPPPRPPKRCRKGTRAQRKRCLKRWRAMRPKSSP